MKQSVTQQQRDQLSSRRFRFSIPASISFGAGDIPSVMVEFEDDPAATGPPLSDEEAAVVAAALMVATSDSLDTGKVDHPTPWGLSAALRALR
jgi:hypothetical protein